MHKKVTFSLICIMLCIYAFYLGEDGIELIPIFDMIWGAILFLGMGVHISKKWIFRILFFLISFSSFNICLWAGHSSFVLSFNKCTESKSKIKIRSLLQKYYRDKGLFPKHLNKLPYPLPCSRVLRGTILKYRRIDKSHYKIWFGDWMVTHSATESKSFSSHK